MGYSRKSVFLEDPAGRFKELLLARQHARSALARSRPIRPPTDPSAHPVAQGASLRGGGEPSARRAGEGPVRHLGACPEAALILLRLATQAGREYDLVVLSVLTYGVFDMVYVDTFIAIFATYLVDLAVRFARRELAKRNIAAKTLIDDRLLL